jgi:hypothetical protein
MCPLRGDRTRGFATRGITSVTLANAGEMVSLAGTGHPFVPGIGEASFRAEPMTDRPFNPGRRLHLSTVYTLHHHAAYRLC